jgi:hypothetical protein
MANVFNSYDLLSEQGNGNDSLQETKTKRKKKLPSSKSLNEIHIVATPAVEVVVVREEDPNACEFQLVSRQPHKVKVVEHRSTKNDALSASSERISLEKAVKKAQNLRSALISSWQQKAVSTQLYLDSTGEIDFRSVLLGCQALHRLAESYLTAPTPADTEPLGLLLATLSHPTVPKSFAIDLASLLMDLGTLHSTDPLTPCEDAKRALAAAIHVMNHGIPIPPEMNGKPSERFEALHARLVKQQDAADKAVSARDEARLWSNILNTANDQLSLIAPPSSSAADGGETAAALLPPVLVAALAPLREFKAALLRRLDVVNSPETANVDNQVAQVVVEYQKEVAMRLERQAAVQKRITKLENELSELKKEQVSIAESQIDADKAHKAMTDRIKANASNIAANAVSIADSIEHSVAAVQALEISLTNKVVGSLSASKKRIRNAAAAQEKKDLECALFDAGIPSIFLASIQKVQEACLRNLTELSTKAAFYRERVAQADRQAKEMQTLGLANAKDKSSDIKKHRAKLEKMLTDTVNAAAASAQTAQDATDAWTSKKRLMGRLPNLATSYGKNGSAIMSMSVSEATSLIEAASKHAALMQAAIEAGEEAPAFEPSPTKGSRGGRRTSRSSSGSMLGVIGGGSGGGTLPVAMTGTRVAALANGVSTTPLSGVKAPSSSSVQPPTTASCGVSVDGSSIASSSNNNSFSYDISSLEQRLARLEEESKKKDAQIAAMLSTSSVDTPTPLRAAYSSSSGELSITPPPPPPPRDASSSPSKSSPGKPSSFIAAATAGVLLPPPPPPPPPGRPSNSNSRQGSPDTVERRRQRDS